MANVELKSVEFSVAKDEEKKQVLKKQRAFRAKCFLKRMFIVLILCGTFVSFQILARKTAPNRFGTNDTVGKMVLITTIVFLVVNIISYLELLFQTKILFDIKNTPILKVTVKKKMVAEKLVFPASVRTRFVMCEKDGDFVLDRIVVRGIISFSNIKTGSEIYVGSRETLSGGIEYYYLA